MSKSLILISELTDDQTFATRAAQSAGIPIIIVSNPKEAANLIASDQAACIFADTSNQGLYKELETAIQEVVGLFSDKINANAFHFLSSDPLEKVQYLIESPIFGHIIYRNYGDPAAAGDHYGRIVKATLRHRAFGLEKLMRADAKTQVVKFQTSSQKQGAVDAVKNYLIAAKFHTRMATVVANAVDELLMNATFDAPIDDLGKPIYEGTSRATVLKLEGKHAVEMHVGFDGQYVGVSAVDYFGSLDKVKLLKHISKIYTEEEYRVKTSVAGAGIGLSTVFRSGGSFFFVSESRVKTEVTVFFKKTDDFRGFKEQFRFLSTQFYF